MTVEELMEQLSKLDPKKEISYDGDGTATTIEHVEYDEYTNTVSMW